MASITDVIDSAGIWNDANRAAFLTTFFRLWNASWERQVAGFEVAGAASRAADKDKEQVHKKWIAALGRCDEMLPAPSVTYEACRDRAWDAREQALKAIEEKLNAAIRSMEENDRRELQTRSQIFEAMLTAWDASAAQYARLVEGAGRGLTPAVAAFKGVSSARCLAGPTEMIPDRVYVGPPFDRSKAPEGFVDAAVRFHKRDWGLDVPKPNSLLKIIEDLGMQSGLHRVRLVAHGMPHVYGKESALNLAIFPGAETWIGREVLGALATSDITIVEFMAQLTSFRRNKVSNLARTIARALPARIGGLGLATRPSDLDALMVYIAILAHKGAFDRIEDDLRNDLKAAIRLLSDLYRAKLVDSGISAKDLDDLVLSIRSAVNSESIKLTPLSVTTTEEGAEQPLKQCIAAVKAGLRKKIERAQRAFRRSAYFDLRGCELGETPEHLLAPWARLFGLSAENVSGPMQFVGFLASAPPMSVRSIPEGVDVTAPNTAWIRETIATEAPRLPIDGDWIVGFDGKPVVFDKASARTRLNEYCKVALAVVAEDGGTIRLVVGEEGGDTTRVSAPVEY